jgi:hypothetical protein
MRKPPSRRLCRRLSRSLPVDGSRHFRLVRGHVVHILLLSRRFVPGSFRPVHRSSRRHLNAAAPADNGIRLNARGAKCSVTTFATSFLPMSGYGGRIRRTQRMLDSEDRGQNRVRAGGEFAAPTLIRFWITVWIRSRPVTARSANSMDPAEASRKTSNTAPLFHHTLRPAARKIRSSRVGRVSGLNVRVLPARETSIFSERSSRDPPRDRKAGVTRVTPARERKGQQRRRWSRRRDNASLSLSRLGDGGWGRDTDPPKISLDGRNLMPAVNRRSLLSRIRASRLTIGKI